MRRENLSFYVQKKSIEGALINGDSIACQSIKKMSLNLKIESVSRGNSEKNIVIFIFAYYTEINNNKNNIHIVHYIIYS